MKTCIGKAILPERDSVLFIKVRNRGREQKVKHIILIEVRNGSREQMAQNILLIIRLGEDVEKKVKASKRSFFF